MPSVQITDVPQETHAVRGSILVKVAVKAVRDDRAGR
jgi:hypothetical protein